jgi:hypothetical protein
MSDASASIAPITIRVKPGIGEWGTKDSERWRDDLYELQDDLTLAVPGSVAPPPPDGEGKGLGLVEVLLTLGSSGAFTAAVEVFKAWLGKKPDRRSADIVWEVSGQSGKITIDASNVDSDQLAEIMRAAQGSPAPAGEAETSG